MEKFLNFIIGLHAGILKAIAASYVWLWFVVPIHAGIPVIGFVSMWGIGMFFNILRSKVFEVERPEYDYPPLQRFIGITIGVLVFMIVVWAVSFLVVGQPMP